MRKHIINLLFAIFLLSIMGTSVWAHEVPDLDQSGLITIHFEENGKSISSGSLTFYRVGEIAEQNGNYTYRPAEAFAAWGGTLNDVGSPELAKSLLEFAHSKNLSGETMEIHDSVVNYGVKNDRLGLYLVAQHEAAAGYDLLDPFLIAVPNWVNGTYVYEVNATPKMGNITATPLTEPPVEESKEPALPQTGQHKLPVLVFAAVGLLLIGSGVFVRVGERNYDYET